MALRPRGVSTTIGYRVTLWPPRLAPRKDLYRPVQNTSEIGAIAKLELGSRAKAPRNLPSRFASGIHRPVDNPSTGYPPGSNSALAAGPWGLRPQTPIAVLLDYSDADFSTGTAGETVAGSTPGRSCRNRSASDRTRPANSIRSRRSLCKPVTSA